MKTNNKFILVFISLIPILLSSCSFFSPNKISGEWRGVERVPETEKTALTAELNLTKEGTFTAKFTPPSQPVQEIEGTYTYRPERSIAMSPEEYGSILFETDGSFKACSYRVTATTLYLNNWTDSQGIPRNLTLFR